MNSSVSKRQDADPTPWLQKGAAVRAMHRLESSSALDRLGTALSVLSTPLGAEPVRSLLLGTRTGHAVHPVLTDLPIGLWSSATLLDLRGRSSDRRAAQLLLASGLVSVLPTVATGLAEWRELDRPESRVGALHAVLNVGAVTMYAASLRLRRHDRHGAGVLLSFAATGVASAAGYLGGHLATARKVGSRHPAFGYDEVGPVLRRP
jgi:uncharacterized membrane protein